MPLIGLLVARVNELSPFEAIAIGSAAGLLLAYVGFLLWPSDPK